MDELANAAKSVLRAVTPQVVRRRRYERRFFDTHEWQNLHYGRFASFAEARAYLAEHHYDGHYAIDHQQWFAARTQALRTHDYPVLHWIERLLRPRLRVFDLGGSIGVTYFLLRDHLDLPVDLVWDVGELPEVVALGREWARDHGEHALRFVDDWHGMDRADVLHTAGTLQFVETELPDMLDALQAPPPHILVNRLAVTDGHPFVTLQNTGETIAPCRVVNHLAFARAIEARGYYRIDSWRCLENTLDVPYEGDLHATFRGFYFRSWACGPPHRHDG